MRLRFPGQYYDTETNLFYNWNRYYDLQLGRYISSDPIGLDAGYNTYGYVEQNPIRYYDPDGQILPPIVWTVSWLITQSVLFYKCYQDCMAKSGDRLPDVPGCDPISDIKYLARVFCSGYCSLGVRKIIVLLKKFINKFNRRSSRK